MSAPRQKPDGQQPPPDRPLRAPLFTQGLPVPSGGGGGGAPSCFDSTPASRPRAKVAAGDKREREQAPPPSSPAPALPREGAAAGSGNAGRGGGAAAGPGVAPPQAAKRLRVDYESPPRRAEYSGGGGGSPGGLGAAGTPQAGGASSPFAQAPGGAFASPAAGALRGVCGCRRTGRRGRRLAAGSLACGPGQMRCARSSPAPAPAPPAGGQWVWRPDAPNPNGAMGAWVWMMGAPPLPPHSPLVFSPPPSGLQAPPTWGTPPGGFAFASGEGLLPAWLHLLLLARCCAPPGAGSASDGPEKRAPIGRGRGMAAAAAAAPWWALPRVPPPPAPPRGVCHALGWPGAGGGGRVGAAVMRASAGSAPSALPGPLGTGSPVRPPGHPFTDPAPSPPLPPAPGFARGPARSARAGVAGPRPQQPAPPAPVRAVRPRGGRQRALPRCLRRGGRVRVARPAPPLRAGGGAGAAGAAPGARPRGPPQCPGHARGVAQPRVAVHRRVAAAAAPPR